MINMSGFSKTLSTLALAVVLPISTYAMIDLDVIGVNYDYEYNPPGIPLTGDSAKEVVTEADLEAYASTTIDSDELIEEINFTNDAVEVKYKENGQLLALIPITFTATVVAHADGSVEVKYPWYSVVTVDKKSKVEAQIKVAVDNAMRAWMVGSVKAEGEEVNPKFSVSESAEVAAQIQAVLKGLSEESGD